MSKTLIPDAQNAELESLLENGLKLFQDHERRTAAVVPSAILNPVFDAAGVRLRSVPFTPDKVRLRCAE